MNLNEFADKCRLCNFCHSHYRRYFNATLSTIPSLQSLIYSNKSAILTSGIKEVSETSVVACKKSDLLYLCKYYDYLFVWGGVVNAFVLLVLEKELQSWMNAAATTIATVKHDEKAKVLVIGHGGGWRSVESRYRPVVLDWERSSKDGRGRHSSRQSRRRRRLVFILLARPIQKKENGEITRSFPLLYGLCRESTSMVGPCLWKPWPRSILSRSFHPCDHGKRRELGAYLTTRITLYFSVRGHFCQCDSLIKSFSLIAALRIRPWKTHVVCYCNTKLWYIIAPDGLFCPSFVSSALPVLVDLFI